MGLFRDLGDLARAARTTPTPDPREGGAKSARDEMIRKGQEAARLRESGLPGRATIIEARDTGERSFGNAVLDLDVAVRMDSGEEYRTTLTGFMIAGTDMGPYATGMEYGVRVDPADRDTLTFA